MRCHQEGLRHGALLWNVAPNRRQDLQQWLETHLADIFENPDVQDMKNGPGCRVVGAGGLVLKRRTAPHASGMLSFACRASQSNRSFMLAQTLIRLGIPTPEPVAWATERTAGLRTADYLLTDWVKNTTTLSWWLLHVCPSAAERTRIITKVGKLLASFHVNGLSNRDMKSTNILLSHDAQQLWVVDLDGTKRVRHLSQRRARRDFRPIQLTLKKYGEWRESDEGELLNAYNASVPTAMQLTRLLP